MKFSLILFIVILYFTMIESKPLLTDTTNAKCDQYCDLTLEPVCGTDDKGETRTFSNNCVLKSENCLRSINFQKTADGPCP